MKQIKVTQTNHTAVVEEAVAVLRAGGIVLFPTETTYGAGVDATNPEAVAKLLQYKARREGKPLSIAVTDRVMAEQYVKLNDQARTLYHQFLPGPVTVVSEVHEVSSLAPGVASEFGTVGVRIPDYPLVLEIVRALGRPITATSANASDQKRPYAVTDVWHTISKKQQALIDLALDAGTLPPNPPSTVIDTTLSTPLVMRTGTVQLPNTSTHTTTETELTTSSQEETKEIAGKLLLKHWNDVRRGSLVFALEGALGMGKTVFAKGVAEFLQITEPITSPTYSYIEEYPYQRHQTSGMFYHLDLWKIQTPAELERLELAELLKPCSVLVIEWFSQGAETLLPLFEKQQTTLVQVVFEAEKTPNTSNYRKLSISS